MSQSLTLADSDTYGADKAIDGDLNTYSYASAAGTGISWFRASLDKEHCLKQVWHNYKPPITKNTHTCSRDTCTCEGAKCATWPLRVYHQTTVSGDYVLSGCKLGDTVEITAIENDESDSPFSRGEDVYIYEIVIFTYTPIGSLLNSLTLSYYSKYSPESYPTI